MIHKVAQKLTSLLIIFSLFIGPTFVCAEPYNEPPRSIAIKKQFNEESVWSSKQKRKKPSKKRTRSKKKEEKRKRKALRRAGKNYRQLNKREVRAARLVAKIQRRLQKSLMKGQSKSYAKRKQKLARISKKFLNTPPEQILIPATRPTPRSIPKPQPTFRDEAQVQLKASQARREEERLEEEMRLVRLQEQERLLREQQERERREEERQRVEEERRRVEEEREEQEREVQEQREQERLLREQQEREEQERRERIQREQERLERQKREEERRLEEEHQRLQKEREKQERKQREEERLRQLREREEQERRQRKGEEEHDISQTSTADSSLSRSPSMSSLPSIDSFGTIGRGLGSQFSTFSGQRLKYYKTALSSTFDNLDENLNSLVKMNEVLLTAKAEDHTKGEFDTPELAKSLLNHFGINLTDVKVKIMKGGFVSGKIIRIEGWSEEFKRPLGFFLKYLRQSLIVDAKRCSGEVQNLLRIRALLEEGKIVEAGFSLVLPIAEGQYNYKGKEKLFTILPAANGHSLTEIVKTLLPEHTEKLYIIFKDVGIALGKFQLSNMVFPEVPTDSKEFFLKATTVSHNDWHFDNIFYDDTERDLEDTTPRASLIDIETLAYGIDTKENKPRAPLVYDLFYAIQQTHKRLGALDKNVLKQMFENLIDGYILAFPTDQRFVLTAYLESCMRHSQKEVEFVDIFPKLFGKLITWKKSPNDTCSKEIISALQKHLKHKFETKEH